MRSDARKLSSHGQMIGLFLLLHKSPIARLSLPSAGLNETPLSLYWKKNEWIPPLVRSGRQTGGHSAKVTVSAVPVSRQASAHCYCLCGGQPRM